MKTRIRNATVVLPDECRRTDVVIEDERIADIDAALQLRVDEEVDASGLYLLPGVIDDQVHFREPGLTHKEDLASATRACAAGGVTTFFDMPNTRPATTSCRRLEEKLELASRRSLVNYAFFIGATAENLEELAAAHRTPGIKIFLGSSTGDLLVDEQEALERIFAETTLPIATHCEDEATIQANARTIGPTSNVADHSRIRDEQAAMVATRRAVDLAVRHRHPLHVLHVSTGAEAELLGRQPSWITSEVCIPHLFLNVGDYERLGTLAQLNPSLKQPEDNQRLWRALLQGEIPVVATDHAPHTLEEKRRPYPASPSGIPSIENSLPLMLDQVHRGRCTIQQVVSWMSSAPARIWRVRNKGRIAVGFDADLVLVDLEKQRTIRNQAQQTRCGWSPWDGTTVTGWPVRTWVMGRLVYCEGHIDSSCRGREVQFDRQGGYGNG